LRRVVATAVGAIAAGNVVVGYMATSLPAQRRLFGEGEERDRSPADAGMPFDEVEYAPMRGGWFIPPEQRARAAVVLVHGFELRRDSIRHSPNPLIEAAEMLRLNGFAVLIPRLGYATGAHPFSGGSLEADDVAAAAAWAAKRTQAPVVLWGFSAGAHAVLTAVNEGTPARAAIADSGYASGSGIVREQAARATHVPSWLFAGVGVIMRGVTGRAPVDLTDASPTEIPVLVIHGSADTAVAPENLTTLTRAFRADSWRVEGVDHARAFFERRAAYTDRVLAFIDRALPSESGDAAHDDTVGER
jgi:alpha-beta hydrolase superfamily lysophospholipase